MQEATTLQRGPRSPDQPRENDYECRGVSRSTPPASHHLSGPSWIYYDDATPAGTGHLHRVAPQRRARLERVRPECDAQPIPDCIHAGLLGGVATQPLPRAWAHSDGLNGLGQKLPLLAQLQLRPDVHEPDPDRAHLAGGP